MAYEPENSEAEERRPPPPSVWPMLFGIGGLLPDGSSDEIRGQVASVAAGLSHHFRPSAELPKTGEYGNVTPAHVDVNANIEHAYDFFANHCNGHWTKEQALGIVANLVTESGCNPHVRPGDGGLAEGIAQWHPDRQANFVRKFGHSIKESTFDEQLQFVDYELTEGAEQRAGGVLKQTSDPRQAAAVVSSYYERPLDRAGNEKLRAGTAAGLAVRLDHPDINPNTALSFAPSAPLVNDGKSIYLYNLGRNDVGQAFDISQSQADKYEKDVTADLTRLGQAGQVVVVLPLSERAPGGLNRGVEKTRAILTNVAEKLKKEGLNIAVVDLHGEQILRGAHGLGVHPANYGDVSSLLEKQFAAIGVKPTNEITAFGDSILRGTMDDFMTRYRQYNRIHNLAIDGTRASPDDPKHEKQVVELGASTKIPSGDANKIVTIANRRRDKLPLGLDAASAETQPRPPTGGRSQLAPSPTT